MTREPVWLRVVGGPWSGRQFYHGGDIVPGRVVKTLSGGVYRVSADGRGIEWEGKP